ncbi:hypothetical protein K1T71_000833 [Dendrolimus kikuchii]|uniref:Uncharacterized protein n=1 Tax=Dendrolimus kikuchii TaxID=765133 RepID=A0ACC1DKH4_9NEOP|nr:hypothetical protein K1T71_000833 [Dendrolimus kikuchii]
MRLKQKVERKLPELINRREIRHVRFQPTTSVRPPLTRPAYPLQSQAYPVQYAQGYPQSTQYFEPIAQDSAHPPAPTNNYYCPWCHVRGHRLLNCGEYLRQPTQGRWDFIQAHERCRKCLGPHYSDDIRPYLPRQFRKPAFDSVHSLSHPGIRTSRRLMSEIFYWPGMNKDVGDWARFCVQCQRSKVQRHTVSDLGRFPDCQQFEHVHVDIVGPLPTTQEGRRDLVTIIDRGTGWPEAIPAMNISVRTVAKLMCD